MFTCRSHSESHPPEADGVGPTVEQLFGYAADQVAAAAGELWPGEWLQLAEHVPSVTGYVRRVEVGERSLYAKYSYLGSSLVSVLRGRCGDWNRVHAAQLAYVVAPGSLLERDAVQLGLLHRLGRPRAHRVAGFRRGVLFTEVVAGATLAQLLRDEPRRTAELLGRTWAELRELHRPEVAPRFSVAIEERSIEGTFVRKFTGIGADVYLEQVAAVVAPLRRVVTRLGRLSAMSPAPVASVLVYGDLKPEHVVFEHYAVVSDPIPLLAESGLTELADPRRGPFHRRSVTQELPPNCYRHVLAVATRQQLCLRYHHRTS